MNNLLRNYLKGVHLTPDEHKNFLTNNDKFFRVWSSVKLFDNSSDKYGTFDYDKFNDHYDETPNDYNIKII